MTGHKLNDKVGSYIIKLPAKELSTNGQYFGYYCKTLLRFFNKMQKDVSIHKYVCVLVCGLAAYHRCLPFFKVNAYHLIST